jgi:hypothetical protein
MALIGPPPPLLVHCGWLARTYWYWSARAGFGWSNTSQGLIGPLAALMSLFGQDQIGLPETLGL